MTDKSPKFYGILYFILIPLFATIYYFLPFEDFKSDLCLDKFLTCIYFSVVTITTLGYGDISATSSIAQILVCIETLSGIVLIGLFLNSLSLQKSKEISEYEKRKIEKDKLKQECEKILRHNKLIEQNITSFFYYTYQVTTPLSKRMNIKELNRQFTLNDLQDLYKSSLSMTDSFSEPVIKYFYTHLFNLEHGIKSLVLDINFYQWKDLETECLNFLTLFKEYEYSSIILLPPNLQGQDTIEYLSNMIKNSTLDPNAEFGRSNLIHPYIMLYRFINITLTFIEFYTMKIKEIKKEINDYI